MKLHEKCVVISLILKKKNELKHFERVFCNDVEQFYISVSSKESRFLSTDKQNHTEEENIRMRNNEFETTPCKPRNRKIFVWKSVLCSAYQVAVASYIFFCLLFQVFSLTIKSSGMHFKIIFMVKIWAICKSKKISNNSITLTSLFFAHLRAC